MAGIDEKLKEKMEEALLKGNKDEAVKLSQELDKQIVKKQKSLNCKAVKNKKCCGR